MNIKPRTIRCALYCRKSSDEGLEQEFNSLDAQREASEAYVKSQTHEGWRVVPARYDDGGYSGGTMGRPALQHLLADIAVGKVDVVVVYKIDRLTRSLADFARIVELFDKHQVSFVSVTQSFNTTSSMGRLTLNVLLSFAQFEREVTGERIRDKIAASKAKGMWMGGVLPLGYDLPKDSSRTLVFKEDEAKIVRMIFREYLKLGSVHALEAWLMRQGVVSKQFVNSEGKTLGGGAFSRGALYRLLRNPIYLGLIRHKDQVHQGQHVPIVGQALFSRVQRTLDAKRKPRAGGTIKRSGAPLSGRIFDALGEPMSPTVSNGKLGKRYRYYVSASLQKGASAKVWPGQARNLIQRISADALESQLAGLIARLVPGHAGNPLALPKRIEVHADAVHLILAKQACPGIQGRLTRDEDVQEEITDSQALRLIAAVRIRNRRGRTEVQPATIRTSLRDPVLVGALQRAHAMIDVDARHLPVCHKSPETQYGRRLVALAFLAPNLQQAILEGSQPADLTLEHLLAKPLPAAWSAQREVFVHV